MHGISGGEGCAEGPKRSVGNIPCIFMLAALLLQRRHLTCFYIVIPLQRQTLVPAFWTGSQGLIPCANTSNAFFEKLPVALIECFIIVRLFC